MSLYTCALRVLGCDVIVHSKDKTSFKLVCEGYSAFLTGSDIDPPNSLHFNISTSKANRGWLLQYQDSVNECQNDADLLYDFEKAMTLWIQKQRTDLFFIHAAALAIENRCAVISGASGSGKSTLAWFLSHKGFSYLSDELAPIHPDRMHVEAYPHALCLKTEPLSWPYLPESTIRTSATLHVPAHELPVYAANDPAYVGALIFIDSSRNGERLEYRAISGAEAAARLYANGLNQLAHVGEGLPAATQIAKNVSSVFLTGGSVEERGQVIRRLLY